MHLNKIFLIPGVITAIVTAITACGARGPLLPPPIPASAPLLETIIKPRPSQPGPSTAKPGLIPANTSLGNGNTDIDADSEDNADGDASTASTKTSTQSKSKTQTQAKSQNKNKTKIKPKSKAKTKSQNKAKSKSNTTADTRQ